MTPSLKNWLYHLSARSSVDSFVDTLDGRLAELSGQHARLANQLTGTENFLLGAVQQQQAQIAQLTAEIGNLVQEQSRRKVFDTLELRGLAALVKRRTPGRVSPVVPPTGPVPLDDQIALFRKAAPLNIDAWQRAYREGEKGYEETSEGNLSHDGHVGATYFRMFVDVHAQGRLLDVGCGPLPLPEYLRDWPIDQIAGIDPLAPVGSHPFPFARTFAENIPWPDASFETVVVGTSLDHVYLLDVALAEIKRVLRPGGRLLLWTALLPDTPRYDPYAAVIAPLDLFHLFHPGRNWFLDLFKDDYILVERIESVASAEMLAFQLRTKAENSAPQS
jgi:SAM-dependent methyltransferase